LSRYPITLHKTFLYKNAVQSDKLSYKGVIYTKIEIKKDFHLNLFSTHLQASYKDDLPLFDPSVKARLDQLAELVEFIRAQNINDSESIVVAGDLNINSRINPFNNTLDNTSQEYLEMQKILDVKGWSFNDLLLNEYGYHPVTFGDFEKINDKYEPKETVLTGKECWNSGQSLDYVILAEHENTTRKFTTKTTVEKCLINMDAFKPLSQVSDHYGIGVEFELL
jgi:endonuclease/exonuclease/phosphatase family metal-dependent hydrolase